MKIKLFTIPNILTLSNLVCGTIALIEIILYQNFTVAFILIVVAATFDFLDGMAARLLGQYSEIGRELDSLADIVSFGVTPSVAMFTLFNLSEKLICSPCWVQWGAFLTLSIVCFSALRLARFNVSGEEEDSFIGLPTPANALFCLSLAMLFESGKIVISAEVIALMSIVLSILLISPLKLFALKFKSLRWSTNRVRYIFIVVATATLIFVREFAVPIIIAIYVLMSVASNLLPQSKKQINIKNE